MTDLLHLFGEYAGTVRNFSYGSIGLITQTVINAPGDVIWALDLDWLNEGSKVSDVDIIDKSMLGKLEDITGIHEHDCNPIATTAKSAIEKALANNPNIKVKDAERGTDPSGVDHHAVEVDIGNDKYIFDWHHTLDKDNPAIYNFDDWQSGNENNSLLKDPYPFLYLY